MTSSLALEAVLALGANGGQALRHRNLQLGAAIWAKDMNRLFLNARLDDVVPEAVIGDGLFGGGAYKAGGLPRFPIRGADADLDPAGQVQDVPA